MVLCNGQLSNSHSHDDDNWGFATATLDRDFVALLLSPTHLLCSACPVAHICFPGVNRPDQSDVLSEIDTSATLKSKTKTRIYLHFCCSKHANLIILQKFLIVKEFQRLCTGESVGSRLITAVGAFTPSRNVTPGFTLFRSHNKYFSNDMPTILL